MDGETASSAIDWGEIHARLEASEQSLRRCLRWSMEDHGHVLRRRAEELERIEAVRDAAAGRRVAARSVVFSQSGRRFGLPLEAVMRVQAAEPTIRLPASPPAVLGQINVAGRPALVFDAGLILGLTRARAAYHLLLRSDPRMALQIDALEDITTLGQPEENDLASEFGAAASLMGGRTDDGTVLLVAPALIHDLNQISGA